MTLLKKYLLWKRGSVIFEVHGVELATLPGNRNEQLFSNFFNLFSEMKKTMFAALLLIGMFFVAGCEKNKDSVQNTEFNDSLTHVTFSSPITFDDAKEFFDGRYKIGGVKVVFGDNPSSDPSAFAGSSEISGLNAIQIQNYFEESHFNFVKFRADKAKNDPSFSSEERTKLQIDSEKKFVVKLHEVQLIGQTIDLKALAQKLSAEVFQVSPDLFKDSELQLELYDVPNEVDDSLKPILEQKSVDERSSNNWIPNIGAIYTGPVHSGAQSPRYIYNTMKWNNSNPFYGKIYPTYEHDFCLNNSSNSTLGPGTYLTRNEWGGWQRMPDVYAETNLPTAYLDTRFQDPSHMYFYTIGSANAIAINHNTNYYTYIRGAKGDNNLDNAYLASQLGYRNPSNNYTTWASFSVQMHKHYYEWYLPIPGTNYWSY